MKFVEVDFYLSCLSIRRNKSDNNRKIQIAKRYQQSYNYN